MSKHFFDFEDGAFAHTISDNMAINSDGNLLMRMGDNMAMNWIAVIFISFRRGQTTRKTTINQ